MKQMQVVCLLVYGALAGALIMRIWQRPQPQRPRTVVSVSAIQNFKPVIAPEPTIPSPPAPVKTVASRPKPVTPRPHASAKANRKLALSRRPKPVLARTTRPDDAACPLLSLFPRVEAFGDARPIEADLRRFGIRLSDLFAGLLKPPGRKRSNKPAPVDLIW